MTSPIILLTTADQDPALAVMVLAFSTDPAVRWLYPDPQQYLTHFPKLIRAFAGQAFAQGTAYSSAGYTGAALWLAPGVQPDEQALIALLQQSLAERNQADVLATIEQMGNYHPREPHWYLPLIGVDPLHQRQSYGSALMRHALRACDQDHTPAYLESTNPANIPFYERHGFEVLGTIQVGASPPLFPMRRPPR